MNASKESLFIQSWRLESTCSLSPLLWLLMHSARRTHFPGPRPKDMFLACIANPVECPLLCGYCQHSSASGFSLLYPLTDMAISLTRPVFRCFCPSNFILNVLHPWPCQTPIRFDLPCGNGMSQQRVFQLKGRSDPRLENIECSFSDLLSAVRHLLPPSGLCFSDSFQKPIQEFFPCMSGDHTSANRIPLKRYDESSITISTTGRSCGGLFVARAVCGVA